MLPRALCLYAAMLSSTLVLAQAPAPPQQGNQIGAGLMVTPERIILAGRSRTAEVMVRNGGTEACSFRVLTKEMAMTQEGKMEERTKQPGVRTLADFMYYSPKQVDLAPGEAQTVRLQVRKPEGLPDGEYRCHMVFQAIPPPTPAAPLGENADKAFSFGVTMVMGISIPVIVRSGTVTGKVTLAGLRYLEPPQPDAAPVLALRLERQGNCSMRGDLTAVVAAGGKLKKGSVLASIQNIAVYPEIPYREVYLPMWQNQDGSLKGARIMVTFQPTELKLPMETAYLDLAP